MNSAISCAHARNRQLIGSMVSGGRRRRRWLFWRKHNKVSSNAYEHALPASGEIGALKKAGDVHLCLRVANILITLALALVSDAQSWPKRSAGCPSFKIGSIWIFNSVVRHKFYALIEFSTLPVESNNTATN